jgi:hypothetical protein
MVIPVDTWFWFRWTKNLFHFNGEHYNPAPVHNSRPFFVIIPTIDTDEQPFWVKLIIYIYVTYFFFTVCCFLHKRNIFVLFQILIWTVYHKIIFFPFYRVKYETSSWGYPQALLLFRKLIVLFIMLWKLYNAI